MNRHSAKRWAPLAALLVVSVLALGAAPNGFAGSVGSDTAKQAALKAKVARIKASEISLEERKAAAAQVRVMKAVASGTSGSAKIGAPTLSSGTLAATGTPGPGGVPDYFGTTPNWAFSPLIRKFVDTFPGLGASNQNNLGQYLSVANPDTITYPGSDYYEIELREYSQKLHSDLPATKLRGYVQVNQGTDAQGHNTIDPDPIRYLGPTIFATKDRPVRVKFTNKLPTGAGGDLFIPVDTSIMGAGEGPTESSDPSATTREMYTQNRATLHLHGGLTPWISDGTPHQWITPAGEDTPYPKGVSVKNVPDMPDPGDGSQTFFYSNQQSARMLWIHDHSFGITRLNVYAGEAQAYLLTDDAEKKLIADGIIPSEQIPLVIQDKTFVDADTIGQTDPTWNWGVTPGTPHTGDLWVPHVYVPAQNPALLDGINPTGRWHYGPWFWPPVTANISNPPTSNPYYDPINAPWEPPLMPATPNPSMGMENYNDTPLVNGTPYPKLTVQPKSYRMRILNAANDRFFNLQMYVADGSVVSSDGRRNTEVKMVPAVQTPGYPELWPTDGRTGGVPDPSTAGPEWIQIASESGFLPMPAVIPQQPVTWNLDPTMFNVGNVQDHSLLLGNAERADVVVDFSKYAGKTLILYNDAPTAFPALDPRTDYFTGNDDHTDVGGTASTNIGFGPNTRTIMQINVAAATPAPAFNLSRLNAAFRSTNEAEGVFESSQNPLIVPDARYSPTYHQPYVADTYVRIFQTETTFKRLGDGASVTFPLGAKAIQDEQGETFDPDYGRMSAKLGLERPTGVAGAPNFILYSFVDTSTEVLQDQVTPLTPVQPNGTQIWKITHNGVDTHPVHFHLFDVQVINRVGWDGFIRVPDDNELGWKDTVRISPLEDTIVALRPIAARMNFGIPDSMRPLNPATPIGSDMGLSQIDPATGQRYPVPISNQVVNFGWEYVWHCHILSHEEMDMMRPMTLAVARSLSATPSLAATGVPGNPIALRWTDSTPGDNIAVRGNLANEIGFRVERATVTSAGVESTYTAIGAALANITSYVDTTTVADTGYRYRVVAYNAAGEALSNTVTVVPNPYFDEYAITPTAGMGGAISPSTPATVAAGADSGTFAVAADPGFTIADVLVDGVSIGAVSSYQFTNVVRDHTIWALFAPDSYDIVSTAGAHGAISPDATQSIAAGADRTYTITPDTGYHIALLTVDGEKVPSLTTYTFNDVAAPHEIAVAFEENAYTITPTAGANGSLTPGATKWLNYGDDATVTVAPDAGFLILDVVVDGQSVGSTTSVSFQNVTADHTVEASFGPSHFAITPTAGSGGTITPGTSQMVATFSDATYTITPNQGYHLASLRVDGVLVPNATSYTFTNVIAAHTISATFARNVLRMTRFGGSRYTNAVNIARLSYPRWRGVRHVVIASGEENTRSRYEAATAAGLAGAYGAPLLLVSKSTLPRAVRSALIAMPNVRVHIVGGTGGVSSGVQSAIRRVPGVTYVDRLSGADSYGTAAAVARRMKITLGSRMPASALIVGATYNANVPDAVAASVVSARTHMPLLYVRGTSVPYATTAAIRDLGLTRRYIVGGTGSVAPSVQTALGVASGDRIGGTVWPITAANLATRAKAEGWLPSTHVGFTYHTRYMTGIGAYLGLRGAPFLGTYYRSVPGATAGYLTTNKGAITQGYVFGPTSSVSSTAQTRLLNYLR